MKTNDPCPSCKGTGDVGKNPSYGPCPDCAGTGKFAGVTSDAWPLVDEVNAANERTTAAVDDYNDALEKIARLEHIATNHRYMLEAYYNMLGETGVKVAKLWKEKGVTRVHYDWGPAAGKMTGEERAKFILDMENAPRREITNVDGPSE